MFWVAVSYLKEQRKKTQKMENKKKEVINFLNETLAVKGTEDGGWSLIKANRLVGVVDASGINVDLIALLIPNTTVTTYTKSSVPARTLANFFIALEFGLEKLNIGTPIFRDKLMAEAKRSVAYALNKRDCYIYINNEDLINQLYVIATHKNSATPKP